VSQTRKRGLTITLAVLLVAVAVGAGLLAWQQFKLVRDDRSSDDARVAVVTVAKDQVLDLTTLDAKNLTAHLKALGDRSTGQFKTQLASLSTVFTSIIGKQDVVSTGKVTGSGVVSISDKKAQVLVAATATVTQSGSKTPHSQRYRMSVDLVKSGKTWLISGMEFVP
jgi:Mce-associated membrane protein